MSSPASGVVDIGGLAVNMYGCLPCPACKSGYRWPTSKRHPTNPSMVLCDDCGFKEPIANPRDAGKE